LAQNTVKLKAKKTKKNQNQGHFPTANITIEKSNSLNPHSIFLFLFQLTEPSKPTKKKVGSYWQKRCAENASWIIKR